MDARFAITVAGDAGVGNSDLTHEIHGLLNAHNIQAGSFQQDDYSFFPSSTDHRLFDRKLQQIGPYEVRVDSHVVDVLEQEHQVLSKYKSPSDPAIPCDSSRVESGERRK